MDLKIILARWCIILFYFLNVSMLSGYIYLVNVVNEFYNDGTIKSHYDYIIGKRCGCGWLWCNMYLLMFVINWNNKIYIVGAGTSGTVIANGINSDNVLIIESGGYPSELMDIPMMTPILQNSAFDWGYETTSQTTACLGLNERKSRWPRGKGFGGSQILNYMIWTRGYHEDYRGWFSDWSDYDYYRDVQPHFE